MTNPLHSADHPMWKIIRFAVAMIALTVTLWANASHFDETELRTIIILFGVMGGMEWATGWLSSFKIVKKENDEQ